MIKSIDSFSEDFVTSTLDILQIPFDDFGKRIRIGSNLTSLLQNDDILQLLKNYFIIGTDGTSASLSKEEEYAPGLIISSAVAWGMHIQNTVTFRVDQRYILKGENRESNSGFRAMLELWQAICILKASKLKHFECETCPFRDYECPIKLIEKPPWTWFPKKEGIALVDLPVEFKFVENMPKGTYTKSFFEIYLKKAFQEIKKHELRIMFITHKSTFKVITKTVVTHLDAVIDSLDHRATALIDIISKKYRKADMTTLPPLFQQFQDRDFFDFDLLEAWFGDLAKPSPCFKVESSELNDMWDEISYFYMTWGHKESIEGKEFYAPSSWLRVGFTPPITPEEAHLAICIEMILGNGHSLILTLAHTACNEDKESLIKIYTEMINKELPTKRKLGLNVKKMNKWKLMKKG